MGSVLTISSQVHLFSRNLRPVYCCQSHLCLSHPRFICDICVHHVIPGSALQQESQTWFLLSVRSVLAISSQAQLFSRNPRSASCCQWHLCLPSHHRSISSAGIWDLLPAVTKICVNHLIPGSYYKQESQACFLLSLPHWWWFPNLILPAVSGICVDHLIPGSVFQQKFAFVDVTFPSVGSVRNPSTDLISVVSWNSSFLSTNRYLFA